MDLSINTARPDFARVQPPVNAPPLKPRTLTVSDGPHGAALRLQGRWLEQAGFAVGTRVHVQVSTGRLIVEALPVAPPSDPPAATLPVAAPGQVEELIPRTAGRCLEIPAAEPPVAAPARSYGGWTRRARRG
jgi:hypothetical protein